MADNDIVKFYGVNDTIKLMRQLEPDTLKNMRKSIRQIAQPAVLKIKSSAPTVAPLSGMAHNGRSAYSTPKVTVSVTPSQRSRAPGSTTSNLVSITAAGTGKTYGFEISDMAGRANQAGKYSRSRTYVKAGNQVRHRLNGQGENFIDVLNSRFGPASRWVYKRIEDQLPGIRREVARVISQTMDEFNRKLNR